MSLLGSCASLRSWPQVAQIETMLQAALAAVEPAAALRRWVQREGDWLTVGAQRYDLREIERVWVVGAGKAGATMAEAIEELLGPQLHAGLVIVKDDGATLPKLRTALPIAGHPLPDQRGVTAAKEIERYLAQAGERDLVLALISGGGSALLSLPVAGVELADLQTLTRELLACGATIDEINTLRKHLDRLKGGGLVRAAAPAQVAALILSDVVGSPLDVIASGPTVADPSTFASALAIIERYGLRERLPSAIVAHLQRGAAGEHPETPKPGDALFARVQNQIIADNRQAAEAALAVAQNLGWNSAILSTSVEGEAREVGRVLAAIGRELAEQQRPLPLPACLIVGGETTVTLRGNGTGGRNQELALAALAPLAGCERVALITLATDGGDGPTDAAGAVVTGESLARAQALGLDLPLVLANNDAYPFFAALEDLLRPGPTGTNVNDLAFLLAF